MRWYNYLFGNLHVLIISQNIEQILNMILARGVTLWDVERKAPNQVLIKVQLGSIWQVIGVVRKNRGRIKIVKRDGIPFLIKKANRRKGLLLGFCLCLSMVYILSSFVWSIKIEGNEYYSDRDIIKMAEAYGIERGKITDQIDLEEVEKNMIENNPDLGWIRIDNKGTEISIEVKEKNIVRGEDNRPAHIVAEEDGIVKELLVLTGTPAVEEGDEVQKGQVLIKGLQYPDRELNEIGEYQDTGYPEAVKAKGVVKGEVVYSSQGQCPLSEVRTQKTGEQAKQVELLIGSQSFTLYGDEEIPKNYIDQQIGSMELFSLNDGEVPVRIRTTIFEERIRLEQNYTLEEAYYQAIEDAENQLRKSMHKDGEIIEKEVQMISSGENDVVIIEMRWTVVEEIGQLEAFEGVIKGPETEEVHGNSEEGSSSNSSDNV